MKLLSVFVIVFIAKISATNSISSVENFSAFIDRVYGSSSVHVSNVITSASLVFNPATASLVAAKNAATVTGPYKIVSQAIIDVNLALASGSAMNIYLQLFKSLIRVFGTAGFQKDTKISKAFADIPQSYGIGITYLQNLLNIASGDGLYRSQMPNLLVNSIIEFTNSVYYIVLTTQAYVDAVLKDLNGYFIEATNALAIIQLTGINVLLQVLASLAATFPSLEQVQNVLRTDIKIVSKGVRDLTVVVTQVAADLQSVDGESFKSVKLFSKSLKDLSRSFKSAA